MDDKPTSPVNDAEMGLNNVSKWQPSNILEFPHKSGMGHAVLVLNREVKIPPHVAKALWNNAAVRCCVDGGTNRWIHFVRTHLSDCDENSFKFPDLITGDFDSITVESQEYFRKKGINIVHTPDQDATDFTKAVNIVKPLLTERGMNDIIVFQESSGRFDHIMANINTLFITHDNNFNIYLLSGNSLTWLLKPGKHSISIPSKLVVDERWCALIPIGHEATNVTTKGLKWNLTKENLSFGGMVSTSNTYAEQLIEIETNSHLIWSMGTYSFIDD